MYAIHQYVSVEGETPAECRRVLSVEPLGELTPAEYIGFQRAVSEERCAELAAVRNGRVVCYL